MGGEFRAPQRMLDYAASSHHINVPLTLAIARALDMGAMEWLSIAATDAGYPVSAISDPRLDRLVTRLLAMPEPRQDLVLEVAELIDRRLRGN